MLVFAIFPCHAKTVESIVPTYSNRSKRAPAGSLHCAGCTAPICRGRFDVVIVPSVQDPEVIKRKFPKGYTAVKPYLRITPQPNLPDHADDIARSG